MVVIYDTILWFYALGVLWCFIRLPVPELIPLLIRSVMILLIIVLFLSAFLLIGAFSVLTRVYLRI